MLTQLSILKSRLDEVQNFFDTDKILNRPAHPTQVARYYRYNKLLYHFINSREGFVHLGISYDGRFKEDDMREPARIVGKYISKTNAKTVLELAAGKAATTVYLAKKFPEAYFMGIDLPNGQLGSNKGLPNLNLRYGDYHDLSSYPASSLDLVYIIEALDYARDKAIVISEIKRVLKPGGHFIVFDCYTSKSVARMSDIERRADKLVRKSMMVPDGNHSYRYFKGCMLAKGYRVIEEKNLTQEVMPSVERLERKAIKMYRHKFITKVFNKFVPLIITANGIAAYLWPVTYKIGLHQYWMTIARLDKKP